MSPAHASTRSPAGPPPRAASFSGFGLTLAEVNDAMRVLSGLPPLRSRCGICGGPYRPDPRSQRRCGYCGGEDWRW